MAWIESHQSLERNPKLIELMAIMQWNQDITIGKLHRIWWWCVDYAEDGDLRKYNDKQIANAVGLNGDDAKKFVAAMCEAKFFDRAPYFRVHDWWHYFGRFLQVRYKNRPEKWQRIKKLYEYKKGSCKNPPKNPPKNPTPNQPNQPNQPNLIGAHALIQKYCESFKNLYAKNPVITAKDSGIAKRLCQIPDIEIIMERFFKSKDKFIVQSCHSLSVVESQINKLLVGQLDKYSGIKAWLEKKESENAEA